MAIIQDFQQNHHFTGQIKVCALVKLIRKAPNPEKGVNPHNL